MPSDENIQQASLLRRCFVLFNVFASISAVSLGGGLVMLPAMNRAFVEKRKWLTNDDMLDTVAIMQSLPGIIAVNMSSLIGSKIAGVPGAIAGTLGVVFPPFVTILLIAYCLTNFFDTPAMVNVFKGVRAGVCALILLSAIQLGKKVLKGPFEIALALIGFLSILVFNLNVILMIILAGIAGLVYKALMKQKTASKTNTVGK
ncbi:MAG: chromate transporter [Victivallales bacterium]|nr:chromate transporter [Victivallales bacterium]